MTSEALKNPEGFWGEIAKQFYFKEECSEKFLDYNFDFNKGPIYIKWMEGAKTNICYNCLDKHVLAGFGDRTAYYWEGNDPNDYKKVTFKALFDDVCRVSNVLRDKGVKKGDVIALYMPMIPELVVAMLAVARIGAVHSIVVSIL
ncbi:unnamed protein product [Rotaria magnacalcarata]|uniref:acetate--CoA ligase n=1 Tax=Rotaria magnacalcarata TaxID=392030 RepID=A0A816R6P9_9BILA|nr:unnamed protein product [Rotaria magnacalcarata]